MPDYFDTGSEEYVKPDVATYDGPSYGTGADEPFSIDGDTAIENFQEALNIAGTSVAQELGFTTDAGSAGDAYQANYASRQGFTPEKSVADKTWDFAKNFFGDAVNEKGGKMKLVELGFGAIAGMAKDSAAKDAAKYKADAESALLTKKDQLEQEANQRFSQSVGGLAPVKKYQPKPLTRLDGSRVFQSNGLINQGVK